MVPNLWVRGGPQESGAAFASGLDRVQKRRHEVGVNAAHGLLKNDQGRLAEERANARRLAQIRPAHASRAAARQTWQSEHPREPQSLVQDFLIAPPGVVALRQHDILAYL